MKLAFVFWVVLSGVRSAPAAPGDLDPSFGTGGIVTTDFGVGSRDAANAVAVEPGGAIVVAGQTASGWAVVRYLPDGQLDPGFGVGGKVSTVVSGARGASTLRLLEGGALLVAGVNDQGFELHRYLANGDLDTAFGVGGRTNTSFPVPGDYADLGAMVVGADGRIVLAGCAPCGPLQSNNLAIARYLADGTPDPSFGASGKLRTSVAGYAGGVRGLAVEQSGAIVAVGTFSPLAAGSGSILVAHYLADGHLDPGFGTAGRLEIPTPDRVQAFLDGERRIVVTRGIGYQVARYRPDGSPDATFGDGGISPDPAGVARAGWPQGGVAMQADGSMVLAGFSFAEGYVPITLVRFTPTGQIDTSFGPEGTVTTRVGSEFIGQTNDSANAVAVDADGRIVVAGTSFNGTDDDIAVVRYRGGAGAPTSSSTSSTTSTTVIPTCSAETVGSHPRLMKIVRAAERRLRAARKRAASVAPDCRARIEVIFDEAVSGISALDGR